MSEDKKACNCENCACEGKPRKRSKTTIRVGDSGIGWLAFCAFIGAAVYFVSKSNGFWDGVLGVLKALVWPAFLVYQAFTGGHA